MLFLQIFLQEFYQFFHLLIGTDGNTEIIINPWLIKIPYKDLLDLQCFKQLSGRNPFMRNKRKFAMESPKEKPSPESSFLTRSLVAMIF